MKLNANLIGLATAVSVVAGLVYLVKTFAGKIAEKGQEAVDSVGSAIAAPIVDRILAPDNLAQVSGNMILPDHRIVPLQYLASPTAQRRFSSRDTILFFYAGRTYELTRDVNFNGDRIAKAA